MASVIDLQAVVKHIVDGSFGESLCRICLQPLEEYFEDIFTKVCKEDKEYCIADILNEVCRVKIMPTDRYKVCSDCFLQASSAYNFYLQTKRSEEILHYYIDELEQHVSSIPVPDECSSDSICIKLPTFTPNTELFDYNLIGLRCESNDYPSLDSHKVNFKFEKDLIEDENKDCNTKMVPVKLESEIDENIMILVDDGSETIYLRANKEGSLVPITKEEVNDFCDDLSQTSSQASNIQSNEVHVKRRRRSRMDYKSCSQCPIKYRFVTKLKEHMKIDHNIDIFVCKVCKAIMEDEKEFNNHLKTHTGVHRCSICNAVFKKRETIITHLKSHETMKELSKSKTARVCEVCGWILKDEESLRDHHEEKHVKKYTCYYCGRRYKGEISFESHIKKHELHMNLKQKRNTINKKDPPKEKTKKKNYTCAQCSRSFVDDRSLMWHKRLHTDERPYACEVCGRRFITANRRNQHALCAHTAPARRCPLCPALFHLRSMVNSHIKKVHLKTHKRRNRISKHQNVFWRTEPVPFQELSVAVQADILELKTTKDGKTKPGSVLYDVQSSKLVNEDDRFLDKYCTVNTGTGNDNLHLRNNAVAN